MNHFCPRHGPDLRSTTGKCSICGCVLLGAPPEPELPPVGMKSVSLRKVRGRGKEFRIKYRVKSEPMETPK